ncbi:MAG: pyridoxal phosphate-dependent aminotransferase, partial [Flavobacteriales bacterium]|nr:pyridoxal phosphate-dependent aminotransferase [Flavobacteriales bacterium]
MNPLLSDRINTMSESQTLAMAAKSRDLKAQGVDVISLSIGEPDFNTPDFIKAAAKKAIDNNYSHYPPVPGYPELREAISKKFLRDNNLAYKPSQIVVSTGAKQTLANIALSILNPGDEVLLPSPYWVSYYEIIKLAGAIPVEIPTSIDSDFKVTAKQLEAHRTAKSKMIWFSSPCNPSGSVYNKNELSEIAGFLKNHPHIIAVSDEIYELINFSGAHHSLASFDAIHNQVITVNGVSKGFAMTGWRIGYMGAAQWIVDACIKMQGQFTSAPSGISQKAAQAAVEADPSVAKPMADEFKKRRDLLITWLNEIPGIKLNTPPGAFYLFPDLSYYFGKSHGGQIIKN